MALRVVLISSLACATTREDAKAKVEEAIGNALELERPHQIGLAWIFDGNTYLQCRQLADRNIRCEAGGALMQISLSHVLTPARIEHLDALRWRLDPSFGNYARSFPTDAAPGAIAEAAMQR